MGVPPAGHRRAAKSCGGAFHPPESGQLLTGLVTPGERLTYRSFGGHPLKQPPWAARTTIFPQAVREASTTCMCPIGSQLQSVPRPRCVVPRALGAQRTGQEGWGLGQAEQEGGPVGRASDGSPESLHAYAQKPYYLLSKVVPSLLLK